MKNIFVFGSDAFDLAQMRSLEASQDYHFHELFHHRDVKREGEFPVKMLYEEGLKQLKCFPASIDAIVGCWDFPVSTMLPLLRRPFHLTSPSFEAVLQCEHKYWSRLEQRKVIPAYVPDFYVIDPFKENPGQQITLDYPFWLKPVKAASSHLGFMVRDHREFDNAIDVIRKNIARFAEPFNYLLNFADLPASIAAVDGYHCIAEGIISRGRQCTLEGYVYQGDLCVYGVIDSIREGEHDSSFSRYQYPSSIPVPIQKKMSTLTERFLSHIGFDNGPFNIEFYWEVESDQVWLLEVNTRISRSHCPLFHYVDGMSHHQVMLDLALGKQPAFPHRQGAYRYAAKFMWRIYSDAMVIRVPTEDEVLAVTRQITGTEIQFHIREGMCLSELFDQDSYSYEIAVVFIAGDSPQELLQKYEKVQQALPLELTPIA